MSAMGPVGAAPEGSAEQGAEPLSFEHVLADELVGLTVALSELAYELGSDPDTLRRHMSSLQAVDRITQTQLAVADMLRSTAPIAERVAEVTLEDMAIRLREALGIVQ
jgi:hypothetical protein